MELYYVMAITDRAKSESMAALYRSAGLHMILTALGRGTATDEHLALYGLDSADKGGHQRRGRPGEAGQLMKSARRRPFY